jgi:GT2 family glycosyltransferase
MSPLVYVILLNHNGKNHLEYCLPSLLATEYQNYRIVLVDNGSADGSIEYMRENFSQVAIVQNDENLGWAGGNNVGIRYALDYSADYIVLQNNDTKVDPRWITQAVQAAEADPRVGFVGFKMLQEYVQGEDPEGEQFEALMATWNHLEVTPTHHITGAALFVRAGVFCDVGLLDEASTFYGEEDDLEHRARRAGYKLIRINVPLWHYNGGSSREQPIKFSVLAMRHNISGASSSG